MLDLFKRATDPKEYTGLYAIPGALFGSAFLYAATSGMSGMIQVTAFRSWLIFERLIHIDDGRLAILLARFCQSER